MKKISLIIMLIFLAGCLADDYYTRPDSKGYYEQVFGALCENCNRVFKVSKHQVIDSLSSNCPYCGRKQDLTMACNRYDYEISLARKQRYEQQAKIQQQINIQQEQQEQQRLQEELEIQKRAAAGNNVTTYFPDGTVVRPQQGLKMDIRDNNGNIIGTAKER